MNVRITKHERKNGPRIINSHPRRRRRPQRRDPSSEKTHHEEPGPGPESEGEDTPSPSKPATNRGTNQNTPSPWRPFPGIAQFQGNHRTIAAAWALPMASSRVRSLRPLRMERQEVLLIGHPGYLRPTLIGIGSIPSVSSGARFAHNSKLANPAALRIIITHKGPISFNLLPNCNSFEGSHARLCKTFSSHHFSMLRPCFEHEGHPERWTYQDL